MDKVATQLERIYEKFPARCIIADFSKMMDSLQRITENTMTNASQYISPIFASHALRGDKKPIRNSSAICRI